MATLSSFLVVIYLTTINTFTHGESTLNGNVEVDTKYGKIKGLVQDFEDGKGVHVFMGVPFAAPPVGELRWKRPQKPTAWEGVYDATYHRSICHGFAPLDNMTEDCLYLNIFAPYKGVGNGPYPVMLYIHGGGYINGAARVFPGQFLAQRGVVVVTVNYRLQALGFMTTEDTVAQGNYGMWDQLEGLKFVQENIQAFGGNPNDITIFGNSAGSTSASLHLLSPHSKPLISKAILQSGTDLATWAMIDPVWKPSDYARELAEDLGCTNSNNTAMVNCLRQISAEEITDAAAGVMADIKLGAIHIPWAPVKDGPGGFLPDTPINIRMRGEHAKIPVITGVTSNEGAGFVSFSDEMNRTEFLDSIRDLVEAVAMNNTDQQHDALNFEYTYWPDTNNGTINRQSFADIISDVCFFTPDDMVAKSQSDHSDTYHYVFGYRSENHPDPKWITVPHGGEGPFVFGYPFYDNTTMKLQGFEPSYNYTQEDKEFSTTVMEAWTNMAKYGNPTPSPVGGLTWGKFSRTNMQTMNFIRGAHMIPDFRQHKIAFIREYASKIVDYKICTNSTSPPNTTMHMSRDESRQELASLMANFGDSLGIE